MVKEILYPRVFQTFFKWGPLSLECSADHPTLGIIKLIRPALNSVRNMFLQQKIPLLLLTVE